MGSRLMLRRSESYIGALLNVITTAVLVSCILGCATQEKNNFGQIEHITVHFNYVDDKANSVCVAGGFNGWSKTAQCMAKTGRSWSIDLKLAPGRYQYLFVIDGRVWRPDPAALLNESNGFGGENSVLIVF